MSNLASVIEATVTKTAARTPDEGILEKAIKERLARSQEIIRHVQDNVPQDRLLKASAVWFAPNTAGRLDELVMTAGNANGSFTQPLTRYALGQAAGRVGFPAAYAADVMAERGGVGRKVVADALTTLWAAQEPVKKILVRSVNERIHGVLSDAFRRLDCRPGVDAFIGAVQKFGAVPYGGEITDTRVAIRAILPRIFKLGSGTWNDSVAIGIILRNSDFGAARYSLALYVERVRCLNGMIGEMLFAQTHLGGRLDEADFYSDRTHKLDGATMVSATKDYVKALLAPEGIERTVAVLQEAASKSLDLQHELDAVLKKAMTKEELKQVTAALQSVDEDEMPLGPPTAYRMSNAISWVANHAIDPDRSLDLQRLAGNYLKAA
jgi:hypothetical protein